ncbi:hypothetical protein [Natrarchaeobaculum aegyptiacum]|uniref:hypothetical protein n=1 Tax=Natrarchaeobaculum aegyptiacum TaxID=745377 RepID=UPI0013748123|nr:hypothetical protein [Natrarchaeobaculum aegyptiacum]
MDQSMIDPISPQLEVVIYGYFVVVAGIGGYLHVRLWKAWRRNRRGERASPN